MKRLEWLEQAQNDVRALDRGTAQRVFSALDRYARTGLGAVKPLKDFGGLFRLRVGDWRVFFSRHDDLIRVTRVLHRKDAYR